MCQERGVCPKAGKVASSTRSNRGLVGRERTSNRRTAKRASSTSVPGLRRRRVYPLSDHVLRELPGAKWGKLL